jgi:hypothetical protein
MWKALAEIPERTAVVVAATNVTEDARVLANQRAATILTTRDFAWTDLSYGRIRQGRHKFTTDDLEAAYAYSRSNRAAVESSTRCGCFHCLAVFPAASVVAWVTKSGSQAETAVCPECGAQAVLPENISQDTTWEFWELLPAMKGYWFSVDRGKPGGDV